MNHNFARIFLLYHKCDSLKNQGFWCSWCDGNLVNSDKKETGQFFSLFGHEYLFGKEYHSESLSPIGDDKMVIFAICSECMEGKTRFGENGEFNNSYGVNID